MRRFWSSVLLLTATIADAGAMQQASTPPKFPIPWGASAGSAYVRSIPAPSQIGVQNCAASLTDGFPPLTFVPASGGGCPPFGQDFNGILKQITQWSQWQQAGAPVFFDSAFSTAIGGYPKGALLTTARFSSGTRWMSLVDNNTVNPDVDPTNWTQDPSQIPIGTPLQSVRATPPFGYVAANGLTIGTVASNATGFADGVAGNSQAYLLYIFIWNNFPSAQLFDSSGTPTARGPNSNSDFVSNKAIATPVMKGLGLMGADTMGGAASTFLAGVPVVSGSTTVPGSIVGENLHPLTAAENGVHAHANTLTDPGHAHANTLTDPGHAHANTLTDPGHAHANTLTDPGHAHANTLTDPGHVHSVTVSDPGHLHLSSLNDPGHTHTVTVADPSHSHLTGITQNQFNISSSGVGPFLFGAAIGGPASTTLINSHATGITASADAHGTGMSINNVSAGTGITASADAHGTGLSVNNASAVTGLSVNNASAGTGLSVNNASAVTGLSVNNASAVTGLSVNNANSGSGAGHNTAQRGMIVYWNLKL
jgi:hypothetical protein